MITEVSGRARRGASTWRACMLAAGALVLGSAACLAQEAAARGARAVGSDSGTYLSLVWLAFLCICAGAWLYMTSWVCDDAMGVGLPMRRWMTIMLGAGAVPLLLAFLLHAVLGLLVLAVTAGAFALYVRARNVEVPERFKLFSRGKPEPERAKSAAQAAGSALSGRRGEGARLEMQLVNDKEKSMAQLVEARPEFSEAASLLVDMVALACNVKAWNVRVEPSPEGYLVLFSLDGVMQKVDTIEEGFGRGVVASLARFLDLSGKGKTRAKMTAVMLGNERVDIEVQGVKAKHGPAIVMSLPDWTTDAYRGGLAGLGMHQAMEQRLARLTEAGSRSVVVSGPADCGKTTTFHALLSRIDIYTTDVATLENALTHDLEQIVRHQVDLESEEAFQKTFDGIVRAEPDVIGVDELTDLRIGGPLFEFADGGKRLLATIQAPNSAAAVARLLEGVNGELLSHTLACVTSQRLLRKLCDKCKEPIEPNPKLLARLRIDPKDAGTWFRAVGCEQCLGAGYRGRTAVFEMLIVSEAVRALMARGKASADDVRKAAGEKGIRTLYQDAVLKVRQGITTLEEVRRVLA